MPFYKKFNTDTKNIVSIWHIADSYNELLSTVYLTENSLEMLKDKKSIAHQKSFLSIRNLLKYNDLSDFDLIYDDNGKPSLINNQYISISHSFEFSCIIISSKPVGIDIEKEREKIIKIKHKFLHSFEIEHFNVFSLQILHVFWGVKEAVYKLKSPVKPIFKTDIYIKSIDLQTQKGKVCVFDNEIYSFSFKKIDNYWLVIVE